MSGSNWLNNIDERERLAFENRVRADKNAGNELNKTGDTATGVINFTGITDSATASLASVSVGGPFTATSGIAVTGMSSMASLSLSGPLTVTGIAATAGSSLASLNLSGPLTVTGIAATAGSSLASVTLTGLLTSIGIGDTGTASLASVNISGPLTTVLVASTGMASLASVRLSGPLTAGLIATTAMSSLASLNLSSLLTSVGIGDTATASLASVNISGPLTVGGGLVASSGASLGASRIYSPAAGTNALFLTSTVAAGGVTISPLVVAASLPSQTVISIQGVFISTASINYAQTNTAFHIPVYHATQGVVGFIAVSKGPS